MIAPPLPDFGTAPPPDPETLPAPPALEWEPLTPPAPAQLADDPAPALDVPAPQPEAELPPPPVPPTLSFLPGAAGEPSEKGTKEIEVWREESISPQMPARLGVQFDETYITGTEPVVVRLQFDPRAAGKTVIVRPDPGAAVIPAETKFQVGPTGECIISVALAANCRMSRVNVYCDGFRTALPLARAPLAVVLEQEALTEGGE
ncbi:MAG TPA: hypothetical protein VGW39_09880 [Chthoniobacterales bacterium]|nr:hypothetical protein [Chthoniobacterales bacterium]